MSAAVKPCRMTNAHKHARIPRGTVGVARVADEIRPAGMHTVRVRWLTAEREWEACYAY